MPTVEWIWKIFCSGAIYLVLFILFGLAVYGPLATALDKAAYVAEQAAIPASAAALVFPLEFLRGLIWTALAIVASISLSFNWKKTSFGSWIASCSSTFFEHIFVKHDSPWSSGCSFCRTVWRKPGLWYLCSLDTSFTFKIGRIRN